ncbi:FAD/NAD(P)-binding domain-containing protein, partial [Pluteus cervinus]
MSKAIANKLSAQLDPSKYKLYLITSRPFYTHLVAGLRTVVTEEGSLEDRIFIPYDKNFVNGNGELVVDTVVSIEESQEGGAVVLQSGRRIEYSILVLTPGSIWEGPLAFPDTKAEVLDWVTDWRKKFAEAQDIVLVGGGAVGIELAGEIKDQWPNKPVTIVHGQEFLLNGTYPEKWRKDVGRRVQKRGIKAILNDYVDNLSPGVIQTRNGQNITADLVVATKGGKPNTAFVASLGEDVLTPDGRVKVNTNLQVVNHPRIYAAGDVTDWKEQKQIGKYAAHADTVSKNIVQQLAGKQPGIVYKGSPEMILVTIGKSGGSGYLGWVTLGDKLSSMLKAKELFVSKARKSLG